MTASAATQRRRTFASGQPEVEVTAVSFLDSAQRLVAAGYSAPLTSLEDGIGDYVGRYLSQPDPYR